MYIITNIYLMKIIAKKNRFVQFRMKLHIYFNNFHFKMHLYEVKKEVNSFNENIAIIK